jgi:hypothetical protein
VTIHAHNCSADFGASLPWQGDAEVSQSVRTTTASVALATSTMT